MKPKKFHMLVPLIFFFGLTGLPVDALAGIFTPFGPEVYMRDKGGPVTVTDTFDVADPNTSCSLKIYNGGEAVEFKRVSSAVIGLNGSQAVGPNEFNQKVSFIEKQVTLSTTNILSVEVRGKPGGAITIVIVCPTFITVPDVQRLPLEDAENAINAAGLVVGTVIEEHWATIPTGGVGNQNPVAGNEVLAGTAVDLTIAAAPPPDNIIPDTWTGLWRLNISYRNQRTQKIQSSITVTEAICPGDPVGSGLMNLVLDQNLHTQQAQCTGAAQDNMINMSCSIEGADTVCDLILTVDYSIQKSGYNLSGSGAWSQVVDCLIVTEILDGEDIIISGVRLNTDPGELCQRPVSSLIQKFMLHPLLPLKEEVWR
jgi:hypothetical protein